MDELSALKAERDRINAVAAETTLQAAELQDELEPLKLEYVRIKEMLETCKTECEAAKEKHMDAERENANILLNLESHQNQLGKMNERVGEFEKELSDKQREILALQTENEKLVVDRSHCVELEGTVEKCLREKETFDARIVDMENELLQNVETIDSLRKAKEQLQLESATLRTQLTDRDGIEEQLRLEKRELEESIADLQERMSEMLRVQEELEESAAVAREMHGELARARQDRASLTEEVDGLTWKIQVCCHLLCIIIIISFTSLFPCSHGSRLSHPTFNFCQ